MSVAQDNFIWIVDRFVLTQSLNVVNVLPNHKFRLIWNYWNGPQQQFNYSELGVSVNAHGLLYNCSKFITTEQWHSIFDFAFKRHSMCALPNWRHQIDDQPFQMHYLNGKFRSSLDVSIYVSVYAHIVMWYPSREQYKCHTRGKRCWWESGTEETLKSMRWEKKSAKIMLKFNTFSFWLLLIFGVRFTSKI